MENDLNEINLGKELQKLRKKITTTCQDCEVILEDVYPNTKRCKKCRDKAKARAYYLRKNAKKCSNTVAF